LLLALPDNCLLAVLQCCAAHNLRTLFSAARADSRLHQADLGALQVLDAPLCKQQQADGLLLFLAEYAEQMDILSVWKAANAHPYTTITLRQLPRSLPLRALSLRNVRLRPGHAFKGMLGAAVADLQALLVQDCCLPDWPTAQALAAALWQLPALETLSIRGLSVDCCDSDCDSDDIGGDFEFPTAAFLQMQQLTSLHLAGIGCEGPGDDKGPDLQPLQTLTRLSVLKLGEWDATDSSITANMLSGMQYLTHLEVTDPPRKGVMEPGVLAGKTRLQLLELRGLRWAAASVTELLSHLPQLQELTHLDLANSMEVREDHGPPAAAFSALTASSKLHFLDGSDNRLPEGIWPHIFPAGGRLPHLETLVITDIQSPSGDWRPPPDGSLLVSCCPGLQDLHMKQLNYTAELLAPLQGLSELHSLWLGHSDDHKEHNWEGGGSADRAEGIEYGLPYGKGAAAAADTAQAADRTDLSLLDGRSALC
jgi:hypothetical protein